MHSWDSAYSDASFHKLAMQLLVLVEHVVNSHGQLYNT
jgi:hypothetical protein